jgi:glycosyltransferase involved in cell wall biosynthesis
VYLEHNAPPAGIAEPPHPAAGLPRLTVVHVTHFNDLFWDCGKCRTEVIEHGIPDPGYRYTGEIPAAAAVVNEPVRRGRVTGTDLLRAAREEMPVDLFGMGTEPLGGADLPHQRLLEELPRRRAYLHPARWTSLGLSLVEAMHLGMPVAALATTEAPAAVPPRAGVTSTDFTAVTRACRELIADPEAARLTGLAAREHALARYGLNRFLADWDRLLADVAGG